MRTALLVSATLLFTLMYAELSFAAQAGGACPQQGFRRHNVQEIPVNGGSVAVCVEGRYVDSVPEECHLARSAFRVPRAPDCSFTRVAVIWVRNDSNKWLRIDDVNLCMTRYGCSLNPRASRG